MGVVYMAEQTEPVTRKVALKIIMLGMDTKQVIARFEAERQALAMMDHPNIARVLDCGATETGRPYFVMELVQGIPITEFCDKNELLAKERLELFIPVCQAIQSAHQKGIIHRDIKLSNVLVTLNRGEPTPKVIDFGIAKATNQKLTENTLFTNYATMIGTPAYMSPEQAEMTSLDVDTRTDVYSLGVLLYELLTRTTPFPEKRLRSAGYGEMQRIIVEEEPEKPSTRLSKTLAATIASAKNIKSEIPNPKSNSRRRSESKIDPDLDWITMKCLEKDRRRRYETANGLAADLKRHLNSEPVSAVAPTFSYQLGKLYPKHTGFVRAVAAISVILIAATIVSGNMAIRMNRLHNEANQLRESESDLRVEAEGGRDRAETAEREATERSIELENHLYVSDMLAVEQAVANEEWKVARELLWRHREETSGNDLRGFEWRYYLQRSRGAQIKEFQPHDGAISQGADQKPAPAPPAPKPSAPGASMTKPPILWREAVYGVSKCDRLWEISEDERALGFSPDERMLITVTTNQVSYRNASTSALVRTVTITPPIRNANFSARARIAGSIFLRTALEWQRLAMTRPFA